MNREMKQAIIYLPEKPRMKEITSKATGVNDKSYLGLFKNLKMYHALYVVSVWVFFLNRPLFYFHLH